MQKHPLQVALESLAEEYDFTVRSYSGRAMYGASCLAISGNDINLMQIGFFVGREHEDVFPHHLDSCRSDNMGLGMVYYWPRIDYIGGSNDDD